MSFITKVLLLASLATTFTRSETLPTFQHIIVIIQENRSPDNLFGSNTTFVPGVDLANAPGAVQWCLGACFNPDHSHGGWEGMWNHGNGWNNGQGVCGNSFGNDCGNGSSPTITYCNDEIVKNVPSCPQETYVSGGYDTSVVQPYFDIATKYGFANYFFQTSEGPSMPAHQFLFTGTSSPSGVVNQGYWNYYQRRIQGTPTTPAARLLRVRLSS
jgi:phospholipase C